MQRQSDCVYLCVRTTTCTWVQQKSYTYLTTTRQESGNATESLGAFRRPKMCELFWRPLLVWQRCCRGVPSPGPRLVPGLVVFPVTPPEAPAQPPPRPRRGLRDRSRGGGCCGSCCASGTAFAACCCSHCSYCCRVMPIWRARRSCSCWLRSMLMVLDLRFWKAAEKRSSVKFQVHSTHVKLFRFELRSRLLSPKCKALLAFVVPRWCAVLALVVPPWCAVLAFLVPRWCAALACVVPCSGAVHFLRKRPVLATCGTRHRLIWGKKGASPKGSTLWNPKP